MRYSVLTTPSMWTEGRTESILEECLGYVPQYVGTEIPLLSFGYHGTNFSDLGAYIVPDEQRADVGEQLAEAYRWCASRFPLSVRSHLTGDLERSISKFVVGHCAHKNEMLSASSAQALGVVFMAADWPLRAPFRFGSLVAHETIHQALFRREITDSPVRAGTVGYSPWKNTLRPGRMVWHAYWTFTCQSGLLAESMLASPVILDGDPGLISFLADMEARTSVCLYSLEFSDIIRVDELERCKAASSHLRGLLRDLAGVVPELDPVRSQAADAAFGEFEGWARGFLQAHTEGGGSASG